MQKFFEFLPVELKKGGFLLFERNFDALGQIEQRLLAFIKDFI